MKPAPLVVPWTAVLAAAVHVVNAGELPERLLELPPEKAGKVLAEHVRSGAPAQQTDYKGRMLIRRGSSETTVPVLFTILPTPQIREGQQTSEGRVTGVLPGNPGWRAIYKTTEAPGISAQMLEVVHRADKPNTYLYSHSGQDAVPLNPTEAFVPFASSDFWLVDLGLDFFHWPEQRVLEGEMRKNLFCYVLESRPKEVVPGGYSRVVTWVERDSGGPIIAEAYDAKGKLLKHFQVRRFQKFEGQWQLREMEIRNTQSGSLTRMQFEFGDEH